MKNLKVHSRMLKKVALIASFALLPACSAMQKQADGRYFEFGSKNNSEATIWLEKIVVDGEWNAPSTGTLGCSSGNINGSRRTGTVSNNVLSPQDYIYLEWYAWHEMARMKAKIDMPSPHIVNSLLLNPPWLDKGKHSSHKSIFIIDFRPDNKVWIKLAKNSNPKSNNEVMILAEGQGVSTKDVVTRYQHFKEGKNYNLDCVAYREETIRLGGYTGPFDIFDKWYTEFLNNREINE